MIRLVNKHVRMIFEYWLWSGDTPIGIYDVHIVGIKQHDLTIDFSMS